MEATIVPPAENEADHSHDRI